MATATTGAPASCRDTGGVGLRPGYPLPPVGLAEIFDADPRPTFIICVRPSLERSQRQPFPFPLSASVFYCNPALWRDTTLSELLSPSSRSKAEHGVFWDWAFTPPPTSPDAKAAAVPANMLHDGSLWTRTLVQSQWAILSCNAILQHAADVPNVYPTTKPAPRPSSGNTGGQEQNHAPNTQKNLVHTNTSSSATLTPGAATDTKAKQHKLKTSMGRNLLLEMKPADLTPSQQAFINVVASVDWHDTLLGPMDEWPSLLRQNFNQILCNSQPSAIYWGDAFVTIYNEAFGELIGSRHPRALGQPMDKVLPEMADQIRDLMDVAVRKQLANNEAETLFFVENPKGPPLETFLKWSIVPLVQSNECSGFLHHVHDTTFYQLLKRRIKMLVSTGEELIAVRDVESFWSKLIEELAACQPSHEVPLAFVYSIQNDDAFGKPATEGGIPPKYDCPRICRLEGALGVPGNHPLIPTELRLAHTDEGLAAQFREALLRKKHTLLRTDDGSLPEALLKGIQWRGFGDPCSVAVVHPIRPNKEEDEMGLLVLGMNPRRPYDDGDKLLSNLLNQKLTTSLAYTVLLAEERRRRKNAAQQAACDQAELREKLAYQLKETIEYTRLFQTVSEFIPNGFSIGDHQGNITFANDLWYRITGYPQGPVSPGGFLACVLDDDDRAKIRQAYEDLRNKDEVEFEFRIRDPAALRASAANAAAAAASTEQREGTGTPSLGTSSSSNTSGLDQQHVGSLRDDCAHRWVLAQAKAERAGDGTIIRTFTCLTDVTVHRRTAHEAAMRAQEAGNLKRMAELATVGMFDMDISGRLLGANNVFYELCGIDKVNPLTVEIRPWDACVVAEDLPILKNSIARLSQEAKQQVAEIRLKSTWIAQDTAGNNMTAPRWVNTTFMPVSDSDGVVQSFTGCLSDVSLSKWQLELETERKDEAIESKRQQDSFIDMTSHEMRNPLSAIVHCSDAIIASLARGQELVGELLRAGTAPTPTGKGKSRDGDGDGDGQVQVDMPFERNKTAAAEIIQFIADSIDNAETIVACAQHQKRIVDDILTMSKLDSKLLAVTPCTVDPVQIGQEAIKMFDVEARRVDINLNMTIDKSYADLGHKYLDLDPSRVKQVLINLLTNALKFTKSGSTRNVSVSMKASLERPTDETSAVNFIPRSCLAEFEYEQPALEGRNQAVYLMFEVRDTGQGLTEEEMASLFNRFVQASSRTHVEYGGSGLGLFISRRLTELQKGAIGVSSRPGVGSTFAFFIEAYVPSDKARQDAENTAAATAAMLKGFMPASSGNGNAAAGPPPAPGPGAAGSGSGSGSGSGPGPGPAPESASPLTSSKTRGLSTLSSLIPKVQQMCEFRDPRMDGILVVEDNLINQQLTRRGLQSRGFTVDVANHGIEALEKLERALVLAAELGMGPGAPGAEEPISYPDNIVPTPPGINIVLMDIEMPVQDGLTCTRRIRALEKEGKVFCGCGGRIPIIAVSANARTEQILQARAAGCDDVIVKPYRMQELVERMDMVVKNVAAGILPLEEVEGEREGKGEGEGEGEGKGE